MILAENSEDPEECCPDDTEKEYAQKDNLPRLGKITGPEISPIAPIGCRKPIVLDENRHEKPEDDFAATKRRVERGNRSRCLSVIVGQSEVEYHTREPKYHSDWNSYSGHCIGVAYAAGRPRNVVARVT